MAAINSPPFVVRRAVVVELEWNVYREDGTEEKDRKRCKREEATRLHGNQPRLNRIVDRVCLDVRTWKESKMVFKRRSINLRRENWLDQDWIMKFGLIRYLFWAEHK